MKNEFFSQLLGSLSLGAFLASYFWALVGVVVSLLIDISTRKPLSSASPVTFSLSYLIRDNWLRIVTGLLVIAVVIRFYPDIRGTEITSFYALLVGGGLDFFVGLLKGLFKNHTGAGQQSCGLN